MYPDRSIFGNVIHFATVIVMVLLLSSCGGGTSDGSGLQVPGSPGQLDGTWFGSLEDRSTPNTIVLRTFTVTISGGAITQILIDSVDQLLTGTINGESGTLYSLTLSDGTKAGFLVDTAVLHATFVDDGFNFGVVQKGAVGLPAFGFDISDTDGSWVGNTVETDFVIWTEFSSTASCTNLLCTARGNGVNSSIDLSGFFSSAFGQWNGTFTNTAGESGEVTVMLSPDKQFAASYSCSDVATFLDTCDFSAWVLQQ